nr:zinc finger, CCHC-type [Tanacetum cinerariifolium]
MAAAMKHMASSFAKLEKFERVDFRRWQKKIHFMLSSISVAYVLTTPISKDGGENPTVEQNIETSKVLWDTLEAKYMAEGASSKKFIKDFKHTLKHLKEELTLIELGSHLRIEESLKVQDSDKPKGNNVVGPLVVNIVEHNNSFRAIRLNTKGSEDGSSNALKGQSMFNKSYLIYYVTYVSEAFFVHDDDIAWWLDSRATVHVCKDRCWFKTYESLNDGSILHMGNESTTFVHGRGCVDLKFSSGKVISLLNVLHVPNIKKNLVSSSVLNNCGYKQVIESNKFILSKHGVFIGFGYLSNHMFRLNIVSDNIGSAFMSISKLNDSILWHARLGHVYFKRMQDMYKEGLISAFDMNTEKCKTCMLNKITKKPFQNVKRETKVLKLIHSDLCDLHAASLLGNKNYFVKFIDDAFREAVKLPDPKLKTLDERGIECIFVGYAEHSKTFRFYVIKPNDSIAINSIIESKDAIFDEHRFSSVLRPSQRSLVKRTKDSGGSMDSKGFRHKFQLYLIEGTRDKVSDQHSYCFNVEDDPKTFDEAMKSQDVAFLKEAINDEMNSIMRNNTWVLTNLPLGCRPLGCKWIFKRKLKVDGTVKKFKARLVIHGFKQKSGIDYFDTYAPVARISTIRLLISMASIHNLIIHQMDMKTTFLNEKLEEDVYMNQPLGFIMPGNENKVCRLIKSLYELKQAHKQCNQKFDEVVLSNGYIRNQADKCVYSKFDASGKGVIICLYVDDMLIFGTDQVQSHYIEKVLKKFNYSDCTPVSTPLDSCEKLMPNRGLAVSQLEYSKVIGYLMYTTTYTRPDIAFDVGKLSRLIYSGYPSVLKGYTDASWINNTEDNSSTSGWVFLLGGDAISWASKKQTCITGSTMEYEFVALTAVGKEAECAATLAKAYSQMYNGKSRHLGVRHSMRAEAHVLQIIPRMCLEPAGKEGEVANFSMLNFFEKMLSRSMNKKEPPMYSNGLKGSLLRTPDSRIFKRVFTKMKIQSS